MSNEKVKLLRTIFSYLKLDEIPQSMVSRRMTVFRAFEENKQEFQNQEFLKQFWSFQKEGISALTDGKITPSFIFSFINDNYDLVEKALRNGQSKEEEQEDLPSEISEESAAIIKRNKIQKVPGIDSQFIAKVLASARTERISYHEFERKILNYLEGMMNISGEELIEKALKGFVWSVYKGDETKNYRLILEEFIKNRRTFDEIGIIYKEPDISIGVGRNVSKIIDSVHNIFTEIGGVFALRRIISIANKIAEVSFSEEEVLNFFTSYLSGGLDSTLTNPPGESSYFLEVMKTYDYDFTTNLDSLIPKLEFKPKEFELLFKNFLNILMRIKIVEWTKNVPIGEEVTILDLISEIQTDVLELIEKEGNLLSLKEMFQKSEENVLELIIVYFSKKLAYSYILRLRRGGVENILLNSFKMMNLSAASKGIGNQIVDIKNYYATLSPNSWHKKFHHEFILDIASKGLASSSKQTVRKRLNLLVEETPKHPSSTSYTTKKVDSELILQTLMNSVPILPPDFSTAEEAVKYIRRVFSIIRSVLNKVWIKTILRTGFELYIESPVKSVWQNEMEDLSRELISYYQNLVVALDRKASKINEIVFESLRESLTGLYYVDENLRDTLVFDIFLKLPENPVLTSQDLVEKYLDNAFSHCKVIINNVLNREVEEEGERKTFDQEIEERISLENTVIDWFVRASQFYNQVIVDSISLEKTTNPNDILLKTIYGGTIYLIEESMKALMLNNTEKINKADFLKEILKKQVDALRNTLANLKFNYNTQKIIDYVLEQIKLWDKVFRLRGILTDLEADNRLMKAIKPTIVSDIDYYEESKIPYSLIMNPGIRGLVARELIADWIKKWANSVIILTESYLEEVLPNIDEEKRDSFEQEVLELLFDSTGRTDIRNFIIPLIVGNLKRSFGFETSLLSAEYLHYSQEVFAEAVKCDSQLSAYFLYSNWFKIESEKAYFKKEVIDDLDFVIYQENRIESCRQLLGASREFNLSDVVKKATGLSLSGLTLQTLVFQLGETEFFSAASYTENPFDGSMVTGLTLELISKESIHMGLMHPLALNASEAIAGLIERNPENASNPDILFKFMVQQLLDEARLVLLKDIGSLRERLEREIVVKADRDVSRCNLKVTTAYKMYLKDIHRNTKFILEDIEFFGEKLENFGLFVQMIFPFFKPSEIVKERLKRDTNLIAYLGISKDIDLQVFPSLIIFDDNSKYKVVFGKYSIDKNTLYIIIAEENDDSNMGLRTINYLLKTREFEELSKDLGLLSLSELNHGMPLNRIKVLKEKEGEFSLDFKLIKNISLGAI